MSRNMLWLFFSFLVNSYASASSDNFTVKVSKQLREERRGDFIVPSYVFDCNTKIINGTAHLSGHVEISVDEEAVFKPGTILTIITADNIEGRFSSITDFGTAITPTLVYSPTSVQIVFNVSPYSSLYIEDRDTKIMLDLLDRARQTDFWQKKFASVFLRLDNLQADALESYVRDLAKSPAFIRLQQYKFDQ